jgi:hypothetical protein
LAFGRPTRREEASDPGTPIERLLEIAAMFPDEVFANPAFELAMVCDPQVVARIPRQSMHRLLRAERAPADFLLQVAMRLNDVSVNCPRAGTMVAEHPATPEQAIKRLYGTSAETAARLHHRSPHAHCEPWLDHVASLMHRGSLSSGRDRDARLVGAMARLGFIDSSDPFVRALLTSAPESVVTRFIGSQPVIAPELTSEFIAREVARMRETVKEYDTMRSRGHHLRAFRRGSTPDKPRVVSANQINAMARSTQSEHRQHAIEVGAHVLEPGMLHRLVNDRSVDVREAVAKVPDLPLGASVLLVKDPSVRVRQALAVSTRHAPVMDALTRDPDIRVRMDLIRNVHTTAPYCLALRDPAEIERSIRQSWESGRRIDARGLPIGRRDGTDRWTAEEVGMLVMRMPPDSLSRVLFATSWACPDELVEENAGSTSWLTRMAAIRHPRVSNVVLGGLAMADANWVVRDAAAERMNERAEQRRSEPDPGDIPPRAEPLRAEAISEGFMPREVRAAIRAMRVRLGASDQDAVCDTIAEAFQDPQLRRVLVAGMLVTSRSVSSSAMAEVRRRVKPEFLEAAEACMAVRMAGEGASAATCSAGRNAVLGRSGAE